MSEIDLPLLQRRVRVVARALGRHGLTQAWGHCSTRLDDRHFLVCAAKPMGIIKPGEDGTIVAVDAPLPSGVLGEVRIHQQIYARRADVGGVGLEFHHNHATASAPLSTTAHSGTIHACCEMTPWPQHWPGCWAMRRPW